MYSLGKPKTFHLLSKQKNEETWKLVVLNSVVSGAVETKIAVVGRRAEV